jgi:DNA-binding NtrC family response regulator
LTAAFTNAGYEVRCAANGADAMAICASEYFDVVLSDVRMPGMNGHDLVRSIIVQQPETRFCLMTGFDLECEGCGRASRPCTLLPKPFKPTEAVALIAKILSDTPAS